MSVEGELRSRESESQGAKIRSYDIVASSIINLRAGQRNRASTTPAVVFNAVWKAYGATGARNHHRLYPVFGIALIGGLFNGRQPRPSN
jgi:hypothetical protein